MKKMTALMLLAVMLAVTGVYGEDVKPAAVAGAPAQAAPAAQLRENSPASGLVGGYRGTSIPVAADQLIFVKKGDRVDILVTFEADMKDRKEMVTATILQNVVVINVSKPDGLAGIGALQLLLNPNEAQYAALSVSQGKKISVTVRAPGDTELHPMEIATFRRLIK